MVYVAKIRIGSHTYVYLHEKIKMKDGKYKSKSIKYLGKEGGVTEEQIKGEIENYEKKKGTIISSLKKGMKNISLTATIKSLNELQEVKGFKDRVWRKPKMARSGYIEDSTGICGINLWGNYATMFKPGDKIKILNAYCKERRWVDSATGQEIRELRITEGRCGYFKKLG